MSDSLWQTLVMPVVTTMLAVAAAVLVWESRQLMSSLLALNVVVLRWVGRKIQTVLRRLALRLAWRILRITPRTSEPREHPVRDHVSDDQKVP